MSDRTTATHLADRPPAGVHADDDHTVPDPTQSPAAASPPTSDARRATFAVLGLALLLAGMLALFAWPNAHTAPRDLPLGLVGPAKAVSGIDPALDQAQPGGFDTRTYPDRAHAVRAIEQRDVDGALVVGPDGIEALTASAASPAVAQVIGQVAEHVAAGQHAKATSTDVVPLTDDDPRGAGLGAALLPIILGGMACAAVMTGVVRRRSWRIGGAAAFSVIGGLALSAVLGWWIGSIDGHVLPVAGVLALATAAVSFTVLGLESLLGTAGLAVGGLLMILLGNALSAAQSAPDMLPTGWGALGQVLPPGATNQLLRSVAFFDGSGGLRPAAVLACWVLLGLCLVVYGGLRRRRAI